MKTTILSLVIVFTMSTQFFGQELPVEILADQVNKQIFDTDGQLPGFWTLTNKYYESNLGDVESVNVVYSNDEKVFRQFNRKGSMIKYQTYRNDKLSDDFTYKYGDDGTSLISERGTYNIDYEHIDSLNYVGVNALEKGIGFTFDLDTLFVTESKYLYSLIGKKKKKETKIQQFDFKFTKNRSIESISIIENNIKVGHLLNKYNELNQVVERQDFWSYQSFGNEDGWYYLNNRLYTLKYDTAGFIKTLKTEIYNPKTRMWETEVQNYDCSITENIERHIVECKMDEEKSVLIELDKFGNWINKKELILGEAKITKREINYYN